MIDDNNYWYWINIMLNHFSVSEQVSLQNGWERLQRRLARGLVCLREGKDGIAPEEMSTRGIIFSVIK